MIIKESLKLISKIFKSLSGGYTSWNMETTIDFLKEDSGLELTHQEAVKCFALTKNPIANEREDGYKIREYFKINLSEFLELIVRATQLKFGEENLLRSLQQVLDIITDQIINSGIIMKGESNSISTPEPVLSTERLAPEYII